MYDPPSPVSLVIWGKSRLGDPHRSSPTPLLTVMCNLSTFHIHLTFLLIGYHVEERFVCAGHLQRLADTNEANEHVAPVSYLLGALHHHLESKTHGRTQIKLLNHLFHSNVENKNDEIWTKFKEKSSMISLIGMTALTNECPLTLMVHGELLHLTAFSMVLFCWLSHAFTLTIHAIILGRIIYCTATIKSHSPFFCEA